MCISIHEIYYKELTHVITEAKKSQHLQTADPGKVGVILRIGGLSQLQQAAERE